jgi:glyoxylase-like metal-dependent hydrolase (beta-lactamase superfamily II)
VAFIDDDPGIHIVFCGDIVVPGQAEVLDREQNSRWVRDLVSGEV